MKMKSKVINSILAVTQSKWMRPEIMTLALVAALLGVAGCATARTATEATVCPECKTVVEQVEQISTGRPEYDLYETREGLRHSCPGCQGALITFFKEGKLQHKCSVCSQSPFTCSVVHPTEEYSKKESK
jgi:hypothetical protein